MQCSQNKSPKSMAELYISIRRNLIPMQIILMLDAALISAPLRDCCNGNSADLYLGRIRFESYAKGIVGHQP
jgi:hypothetical protein